MKEITRRTCRELIDEMVITEAKILMGDSSFPMAQVADLLIFCDQFSLVNFSKVTPLLVLQNTGK